jgi:hypothetical protein
LKKELGCRSCGAHRLGRINQTILRPSIEKQSGACGDFAGAGPTTWCSVVTIAAGATRISLFFEKYFHKNNALVSPAFRASLPAHFVIRGSGVRIPQPAPIKTMSYTRRSGEINIRWTSWWTICELGPAVVGLRARNDRRTKSPPLFLMVSEGWNTPRGPSSPPMTGRDQQKIKSEGPGRLTALSARRCRALTNSL